MVGSVPLPAYVQHLVDTCSSGRRPTSQDVDAAMSDLQLAEALVNTARARALKAQAAESDDDLELLGDYLFAAEMYAEASDAVTRALEAASQKA